MSWFTDLVAGLPNIKTKFQLTGLIIGLAAFVAVKFAAPDAVIAQISAGVIGVLFLVFGQIFQAIPQFREADRFKLVISLFVTFVLFILILVGMILYSLNGSPRHTGKEVGIGLPIPMNFDNFIPMVNEEYNVNIFFSSNCDDVTKKGAVQPNSTKGENMKDYLEKLRSRILKVHGGLVNYYIKAEGSSYEIICQ